MNTLPGMTATVARPEDRRGDRDPFPDLCERILDGRGAQGLARHVGAAGSGPCEARDRRQPKTCPLRTAEACSGRAIAPGSGLRHAPCSSAGSGEGGGGVARGAEPAADRQGPGGAAAEARRASSRSAARPCLGAARRARRGRLGRLALRPSPGDLLRIRELRFEGLSPRDRRGAARALAGARTAITSSPRTPTSSPRRSGATRGSRRSRSGAGCPPALEVIRSWSGARRRSSTSAASTSSTSAARCSSARARATGSTCRSSPASRATTGSSGAARSSRCSQGALALARPLGGARPRSPRADLRDPPRPGLRDDARGPATTGVEIRLGQGELPEKLARLERVLAAVAAEGQRAEVLHLDNRRRPDWVAVRLRRGKWRWWRWSGQGGASRAVRPGRGRGPRGPRWAKRDARTRPEVVHGETRGHPRRPRHRHDEDLRHRRRGDRRGHRHHRHRLAPVEGAAQGRGRQHRRHRRLDQARDRGGRAHGGVRDHHRLHGHRRRPHQGVPVPRRRRGEGQGGPRSRTSTASSTRRRRSRSRSTAR